MLGPSTTPSGVPLTRSATARRASSTITVLRSLAANAPCTLAIPSRRAAAIASMTAPGTCVPAAPSSSAQPSSRPGNSARMLSIDRFSALIRRHCDDPGASAAVSAAGDVPP